MAKLFAEISRAEAPYRPVKVRRNDYDEVEAPMTREQLVPQARRCLNCGVPFCHGTGCPLHNRIPDFNTAVATGRMQEAWEILSETSAFPEFTSRVCPALCEGSCTLGGAEFDSVTIRQIEKLIVETAYANGWVKPLPPVPEEAPHVAVIGSGPAGLAAAHTLTAVGFHVTVYEAGHEPGGLLRYGIPHFKLDKRVIDRRLALLKQAGVRFVCDAKIGEAISGAYLAARYAGVVVACGTPVARDLRIPGRESCGVHFALEFLQGQNRVCSGEAVVNPVDVKGRRVLIIGGGDTGSDCAGTAIRNGATSVMQIEIMPEPPEKRSESTLWPKWPYLLRTSSSQKEGMARRWALASDRFEVKGGRVTGVRVRQVKWSFNPWGKPLSFEPIPDTEELIRADVVLIAMGFIRQERAATLASLGLPDTDRVLVVGDAANGPSLVVRALADAKNRTADWAAMLKA